MNIHKIIRTRLTDQELQVASIVIAMAASTSYSERDLDFVPLITFTFIENFIKSNKKSSGEKSMNKGYKYFSESYIQDLKVTSTVEGCHVVGNCYRSQRKNEKPHQLKLSFKNTSNTDFELGLVYCTCPIGLSGLCGHAVGALYQLAEYKKLGLKAIPEDVAKTSQPQTWHTPRGPKIQGKAVQDVKVSGYKKVVMPNDEAPRTVQSTLYNPIRGDGVTWDIEALKAVDANMLVIPALGTTGQKVDCKYGKVEYGSVLSYQQKLESNCVMNIFDGETFPDLPCNDVMENLLHTTLTERQMTSRENLKLSITEASRFESQTRSQSQNPFWYKLRRNRITASKFGEIFKRKKDPSILVKRLKSTRHVMTVAMKQGLASEPTAADAYIKIQKNKVNIYPCGVVVNVWAPWLAASPDRKVYNPDMTPPYGLLEIKCPQVGSVLECPYLTKNVVGSLKLNRNHSYYYQVLAQLAVTGLEWCDLFIWCQNDNHKETIYFNRDTWQTVKNKIDQFYFNYFL